MSRRRDPLFRIRLPREWPAAQDPILSKIAASRVRPSPPDIELLRWRLAHCPGQEIVHADGRPECTDGSCDGGLIHRRTRACECCGSSPD